MENRPNKKGPDELEILRKVLFKTISRWYFVLLSVGIAMGVAFLIIRYTIPGYTVSAEMMKKEAKEAAEYL